MAPPPNQRPLSPGPTDSGRESTAPLPCPRCAALTTERAAGDRTVFPCDFCGGIWIDNRAAQPIAQLSERNTVLLAEEVSRSAMRSMDTRPGLACPVCNQPLLRV